MSTVGGIRTVRKMSQGTLSGQSRVAQPIAFPRSSPRRKKLKLATGIEAWYDASDLTMLSLDGSNKVRIFYDKSGKQRHLFPPVFTSGIDVGKDGAPSALNATKNGLNVVDFDEIVHPAAGFASLAYGWGSRGEFNFMHSAVGTTIFVVWHDVFTNQSTTHTILGTTLVGGGIGVTDTGWMLEGQPDPFTNSTGYAALLNNEHQGGNEIVVNTIVPEQLVSVNGGWRIACIRTVPTQTPRGEAFDGGDPAWFTAKAQSTTANGLLVSPDGRDCAYPFYIGSAPADGVKGLLTTQGHGGAPRFLLAEVQIFSGDKLPEQRNQILADLQAKWAVY